MVSDRIMTYVSPCPEDLKAIRAAIDKDDFEFLNILANRLLANSVYQPEDQERFLMAGFFAKDLAIELLSVSASGKTAAISTAKATATPFLTRVISLTTSGTDFNFEEFWRIYTEYAERLRKISLSEIEEHAYSENRLFTRKATDWLLQYLHEQKDLLLDSRNSLLEGILNEAGRIYRAHGAELRELQAFAVIDYLQKVYAYVKHAFKRPDGSLEPSVIQSEIHPLVDRITSLFDKPPGTSILEGVDNLLLQLLLKWRQYFIRYMELKPPREVAPERGIELPEETKKRITEAITKTLERETRK